MGTPRVVTAIALFAGVRLAALDHLIAVTVRIHHRLVYHCFLLREANLHDTLSSKNPDLQHYL